MEAARAPQRGVAKHCLFLLVVFVVGTLYCCNVSATASSVPSTRAIFGDDWSELDHTGTLAEHGVGSRHLLQSNDSGGGVMVNGVYELATSRTNRRNPLKSLKIYRGGYNLSSSNYGASVGYTGLPAFILLLLWIALGLILLLSLCLCCCCCRHRTKHEFDHGRLGYILPLLALILFSIAAIIGSILLWYAQGKFNRDLKNTLNYVIDESARTEDGLRNVSSTLTNAANINIGGAFSLSAADKAEITNLNRQLNSSANELHSKTYDNRHKIKNGIDIARIILIVVAAVMLALVLLGLLFSACGLRPIVYLLVVIGWFLVIGTWILCAVFIIVDNGVGDTCLAMQEWVENPQSNTSLDRFLPCDESTAASALTNSRSYTSQIIVIVNRGINNVANINAPPGTAPYFNQSGPSVPNLCTIYGPAPNYPMLSCPNTTVTFDQATARWSNFECTVDANQICTTQGRLTPTFFNQLSTASTTAGSLVTSADFLASTANCTFVRNVFTNIHDQRCHDLRKWAKWIWIGLTLTSAGSMLSILSWIFYIRRKNNRYKGGKNKGGPSYKGQSQPYSPSSAAVSAA